MRQAKGKPAARIIAALDQRQLTTRKAHEPTGFAAADFSRIRNADHGRFTLDRMIRMPTRSMRRWKSGSRSNSEPSRRGQTTISSGPDPSLSRVQRKALS
jgi:hypothetical protein